MREHGGPAPGAAAPVPPRPAVHRHLAGPSPCLRKSSVRGHTGGATRRLSASASSPPSPHTNSMPCRSVMGCATAQARREAVATTSASAEEACRGGGGGGGQRRLAWRHCAGAGAAVLRRTCMAPAAWLSRQQAALARPRRKAGSRCCCAALRRASLPCRQAQRVDCTPCRRPAHSQQPRALSTHLWHLGLREQHVAHLLAPHRLGLVLRGLPLGAALRGQLGGGRLSGLTLFGDGLLELQGQQGSGVVQDKG